MTNLELWRTDRGPLSVLRNWDSITRELDRTALSPAVDVQEDEQGFLLSFDLPGFKKEDLNIEIVANRLTVSGKRSREAKDARYHRVERNYGEFRRIFTLPENAKGDRIEANSENGVLYLMVPKAEIERPKKVEISEGKGNFSQKKSQAV